MMEPRVTSRAQVVYLGCIGWVVTESDDYALLTSQRVQSFFLGLETTVVHRYEVTTAGKDRRPGQPLCGVGG